MSVEWNPDLDAELFERPGLPPIELGSSRKQGHCPDVWTFTNGDVAVVGVDVTDAYLDRLPEELHIYLGDERLVAIPRATFESAARAWVDSQRVSEAAG
jgi:hypothetical protein